MAQAGQNALHLASSSGEVDATSGEFSGVHIRACQTTTETDRAYGGNQRCSQHGQMSALSPQIAS